MMMNDIGCSQRSEIVTELFELGTWEFDPRSETFDCNGHAKSLFGFTDDAPLPYLHFLNAIHPEDRERIDRTFRSALDRGIGRYAAEFRTAALDGVERVLDARGVVHFGDDKPIRVIGAVLDITERKRVERQLAAAKERADAAAKAKSEFLANASHEIRTPLGVMLGFADLALDPAQSWPEKESCLRTIKKNGETLIQLMNEILDLSKAEAGRIDIDCREFDLKDLLNELESFFQLTCREKKVQLRLRCEGSVPRKILSDAHRVRQVLVNLVGNSLKFTEKGHVEVLVKPAPAGLRFEIADTGIGISPENRPNLFREFGQANPDVYRKYGGTGLGLALSLKIARVLGGDLSLGRSEPGAGSTFIFDLPAAAAGPEFLDLAARPAPAPDEKSDDPTLGGVRILVADDAPEIRLVISTYLQRAGAVVETAENGVDAIQKISETDYDIVLMDIQMPVMNGFEATSRLREWGYRGPIIALTAYALAEERDRCLKAGFDDHLTKPIDRNGLLTEVKAHALRPARSWAH